MGDQCGGELTIPMLAPADAAKPLRNASTVAAAPVVRFSNRVFVSVGTLPAGSVPRTAIPKIGDEYVEAEA